MKYEIDLPQLPDTHEIVGHVVPQAGDLYLTDTNNVAEWVSCERGYTDQLYITARKKRTLADWANEQELFKALAKMRANKSLDTLAIGYVDNGWWDIVCSGKTFTVDLGIAPSNGTLKLTDGKWELA